MSAAEGRFGVWPIPNTYPQAENTSPRNTNCRVGAKGGRHRLESQPIQLRKGDSGYYQSPQTIVAKAKRDTITLLPLHPPQPKATGSKWGERQIENSCSIHQS